MRPQAVRIFEAKQFWFPHQFAQWAITTVRLGKTIPRRVKQLGIESFFVEGAPNGLAAEGLYCFDARFSGLTLFRQRLDDFQGVEPVMFGDMISDCDDLAETIPALHVSRRAAPCDRER